MVKDILKEIELDLNQRMNQDFENQIEEMLDNDEITPAEAAFMQGWEEAG